MRPIHHAQIVVSCRQDHKSRVAGVDDLADHVCGAVIECRELLAVDLDIVTSADYIVVLKGDPVVVIGDSWVRQRSCQGDDSFAFLGRPWVIQNVDMRSLVYGLLGILQVRRAEKGFF